MPSLARSACSMKAAAERTGQSDAEHHGKAADLVLQGNPLAD